MSYILAQQADVLADARTMSSEAVEQLAPATTPRVGRMRRAQSAFKVKMRRADNQQVTAQVKPSQLARRGWRGFYQRKPRKTRTAAEKVRDTEKSNLLFQELFTAVPMVVAAASTVLVDTGGEQRVPVLLNQLSARVVPYESESKKILVKIMLEYCSGPAMLKWSLIRSYRDFMFLHGHLFKSKVWHRRGAPKPPHLPRPKDYGRKFNLDAAGEEVLRDDSSGESQGVTAGTLEEALQNYLERIFHVYSFHGDSNRVLHFIELSRLGITLAAETNFHGKEGPVFVRGSASNQGWRVRHWQPHDISSMVQRHTQKWLLVRESYLVITESINSRKILDVFLVDPTFTVKSGEEVDLEDPTQAKGLFLTMHNASRALRVATRGELDLGSWVASITRMQKQSPWAHPHRFDSFAPVRKHVSCEWFVDGRDYMWVVSEALENARDTIFILDWWLSPELYLRRPPEGNQQWRLDRVLLKAAERGVKIYVVVYRNIDLAIPIDSLWTKHSLLDMHPNIHVLRSPNQPKQKAAVFWAHHEKICVIDSTIAFCGGIDLCYGRWDTPQHTLVDDARKPFFEQNEDATKQFDQQPRTQTWPGKDYSNPRVKDFFELDKPWDDMYDRQVTPRMPWHDVHQSVLGQPARDLARHFVQRWNYVIRQKLPSRSTPLLIPPQDFTEEELHRYKLTGTCEYQVLRSSCHWSLGLKHHEQSIQNAYLSLIGNSEHFIYIENQFFVTATEVDGVQIENQIGNALVQRIIQAHERHEKWRAIIVIPLMPGFEAPVDSSEASSVRVICQCQFNSISRGSESIFYKLESAGIIPDQYISFFSLRKWGKIGPQSRLTTEQLYIHAKMMVADDRAAIIGSANINERSMRGIRDSEVAVCVRDTASIESHMAGKKYKVGKFAYTLRLRAMREHLGIDTDKVDCIEQLTEYLIASKGETAKEKPSHLSAMASPSAYTPLASPLASPTGTPLKGTPRHTPRGSPKEEPEGYFVPRNEANPPLATPAAAQSEALEPIVITHSFNWYGGTDVNPGIRDHKKISTDRRIQGSDAHKLDVEGKGCDQYFYRKELRREDLQTAVNPAIDIKQREEAIDIMCEVLEKYDISSVLEFKRLFYYTWCGISDQEVVGAIPRPMVDEEGNVTFNECLRIDPWSFDDPVSDEFYLDKWLAAAERNTDIYRQVFRCQPDNEVTTWREYKKSQAHESAFYEKQASEGGPEAPSENKAPERVNIHVQANNSGLPDVKVERSTDKEAANRPELGKGIPGTIVRRHQSSKDYGTETTTPHEVNGANGTAHDQKGSLLGTPLEVFTSASSGKSSSSSSSEERHYEGHAGSSSTAGMPGIPSLARLLGTEAPFDPKNSEFPENGERQLNGTNGRNEEAHSHHKKRQYVDAPQNFNAGVENPIKVEDTNKADDSKVESTDSSTTMTGSVSFPHVERVRTSQSKTLLSHKSNDTTTNGGTRRVTAASRRWKHYDQVLSAQSAEEVLSAVTGNLVIFPTEWLRKEIESGNWNFQMDRMTPLDIYD